MVQVERVETIAQFFRNLRREMMALKVQLAVNDNATFSSDFCLLFSNF